jgi:hypothetical protein
MQKHFNHPSDALDADVSWCLLRPYNTYATVTNMASTKLCHTYLIQCDLEILVSFTYRIVTLSVTSFAVILNLLQEPIWHRYKFFPRFLFTVQSDLQYACLCLCICVCVWRIHNENCTQARALAFFPTSVCPSVFVCVTNLGTSERIFMTSETVSKRYIKISWDTPVFVWNSNKGQYATGCVL